MNSDRNVNDEHVETLAMPLQVTASQQNLLERLHQLTSFAPQLILLAGPSGAGKSAIVEAFLEQASDYANLAYLPSPGRLDTDKLRRRLLQQLINLHNGDDLNRDLPTIMASRLSQSSQPIMLVIDDADTLPNEFVAELHQLVQTQLPQRVSVLLAGNPNWAGRAKQGLTRRGGNPPEHIAIEPLSPSEANWYARALLSHHGSQLSDNKINYALEALTGYPGEIQESLERLVLNGQPKAAAKSRPKDKPEPRQLRDDWQKPAQSNVLIILLGAAIISLATTLVLHRDTLLARFNDDAETSSVASQSADSAEVDTSTVEPTTTNQQLPTTDEVVAADPAAAEQVAEQDDQPTNASRFAMDYESALSRLRESAANYENNSRVDVGLTRPTRNNSQATEQVVDVAAVNPPENDEPELTQQETAQQETAEPETTTADANEQPATNPWLNRYDNQQFMRASGSDYIIQVAAFSELSRLQQFIDENQVPAMAIYHTQRNSTDWYVITSGQFSNIEQARAAVSNLPPALQAQQPWPKSIAAVQNELAAVIN